MLPKYGKTRLVCLFLFLSLLLLLILMLILLLLLLLLLFISSWLPVVYDLGVCINTMLCYRWLESFTFINLLIGPPVYMLVTVALYTSPQPVATD